MCGITGVAFFDHRHPFHHDRLRQMCDTIVHRGPDQQGLDIQDGVALGMRRLSIIDLSGGSQPIFNEDKSIRLVFNGEIYNYRELRADLIKKGHVFYTNTDTEAIVHAYEQYGDDFPNYLNGMFAIALHDMTARKLYLVRDHLGIKPLFYAETNGYIVFGSEIKAILASGLIERNLDVDGLGQFLSWEYIPGTQTLFQGIKKLEAGAMIALNLDAPQYAPVRYWDIPVPHTEPNGDIKYWEERVDAKIAECVQRQLVSDVPLGAFLSGGVDSSLVVSAMGNAETFSIGFDDQSYNELGWARKVADHLGVNHKDEIIQPKIVDLFERLMYFMDDPIGDFSIFPTYLVSRHARNEVTVALSGDGGDELFGGYETYMADSAARRYMQLPAILRKGLIEPAVGMFNPKPAKKGLINKALRFVEGVQHPESIGHARWRLFAGETMRSQLFTSEAHRMMPTPAIGHILDLFKRAGERSTLNRRLYVDVKSYLVDNCLVKSDRMSMAVSLEARVPLLDKELVAMAFQIPDELKIANGQTKVLLKKIAARHVPKSCVYRPKEGFSIPIKNWLKKELRPLMDDLLDEHKLQSEGLFNSKYVGRLKREHLAGAANHSHVIWSMMVFQAWRKRWLEA
jgi:asparagine synthase (glutamine-hydrolysing)